MERKIMRTDRPNMEPKEIMIGLGDSRRNVGTYAARGLPPRPYSRSLNFLWKKPPCLLWNLCFPYFTSRSGLPRRSSPRVAAEQVKSWGQYLPTGSRVLNLTSVPDPGDARLG